MTQEKPGFEVIRPNPKHPIRYLVDQRDYSNPNYISIVNFDLLVRLYGIKNHNSPTRHTEWRL